jgi:hypothetical protein
MFSPMGVFRSVVSRLKSWLPRPSEISPKGRSKTGFLVTRLTSPPEEPRPYSTAAGP